MKKKSQNKKTQAKRFDLTKFIPVVAILGLLTTIELIVVYFTANFVEGAAPSFCNINSTIDCDAVAKTNYALFFGIPNAIWGFMFYAFVLVLYYAKKLQNFKLLKFLEVFEHPKSYIFLMSLAMVLASCVFGYISTSVIKKICLLCFVTYFLDFLLLIVSKPQKSIIDMIITTINDFLKAISNKVYAVAFSVVVILGLSGLIFINNSNIFVAPEKLPMSNDITKFEPVEEGNELGTTDAKVVINEFTDIQCPFCALSNTVMNKITADYDNVRVLHHNMPLDKDCNPLLKTQMHENSCLYAQYAIAAKKQGKFWGLMNKMFKNNTELSEEKVLELAKELNMNTTQLKKDAHSKAVIEELKEEVQSAIDMQINSTPTYIINGKKYNEGVFKYHDLEKIVQKAGATHKKDEK